MTYAQPYSDPTAVVGRRILAYGIDVVIMAIISIAILVPAFSSASVTAPSGTVNCGSSSFDNSFNETTDSQFCFDDGDQVRYIPDENANGFTVQVYGLSALIGLLNLVVLQGLTGASVGKLLVGLRVIREDGKIAGIGWAFLRWILLFVDALCCFLPGAVLVFTTKGHRRIGDMAASTFVVRSSSVGHRPIVPGVTAGSYSTQAAYGGYPQPGAPQPGYGQQPGQTWSPPGQPAWGQPDPQQPSTPMTPAGNDGPIWDEARNTYIQFDPAQGAWVQWDTAKSEWVPISQ